MAIVSEIFPWLLWESANIAWNALVQKCFLGITTIWNFCRGHRIFRVAADSKTLNHYFSCEFLMLISWSSCCLLVNSDFEMECRTCMWTTEITAIPTLSFIKEIYCKETDVYRLWIFQQWNLIEIAIQILCLSHVFHTLFALVASYLHASLTHHAPWNKWAFSKEYCIPMWNK